MDEIVDRQRPGGRADRGGTSTVPQLFESVVAKAGDQAAVLWEGATTSYTELNDMANRLARCLIARGAGPDTVVAVTLPRSCELIAALLAVLKAGAAYLALDPAYPAERLAYMATEAEPVLSIGTTETAALLGAERGVPHVALDDSGFRREWRSRPGHDVPDTERRGSLRPGNLMYIVFTSGSSGSPKGVAVSHAGVEALVAGQSELICPGPGDRVLQWASTSFDAAFWDVSMALLSGATLVMAPAGALLPGQPLRDTMIGNRVTHATLPPVALSVTDAENVLPGGTLVSTGDALPPALARTWGDGRTVLNGYGPTEVTVGITMSVITDPDNVTIGQPLPGSRVHVLNGRLEAVDAEQGELYLKGPGLARGYLGRPGLTAGRFVADPDGPPGTRMYRSGDRGLRRPDGDLEFAGRADDQVKVRGFRVELGEIEARLAAHPAVKHACAMVTGDLATSRILGYVTTSAEITGAELRQHVARALPDHMVPSTVVVLPRFPVMPNGKLDRAALAAVQPDAPGPEAVKPDASALSDELCHLVRQVLGIAMARPEDNFFDLGGHSVLAAMLARRIQQVFTVSIPMRSIFEAATLAELVTSIDAARRLESPGA